MQQDREVRTVEMARPTGAILLSLFTVIALIISMVFQMAGNSTFGLYTTGLAIVTGAAAAILHARTR
jgi:hypothetical protein